MSIQADRWIIEQAKQGMIEPFETNQVRSGAISYGVSSYEYDMRVAREFPHLHECHAIRWSIRKTSIPTRFVEFEGDVCIVPANSFALARSGRIFPHSAQCRHALRRKIDLCALRDYHKCDAFRAGMGRLRNT